MNNMGLFKFRDEEIKYINANERYLDDFKKVYINKIGTEGVDQVISNSISVFSKCINQDKSLVNKTGIVLGQVQSGKTSNFIGLIAMGFDNGIDIVVLIGGKDSKLLTQNDTRLKEVFNYSNSNRVIIENVNYVVKNPKIYFNHLDVTKRHKLIITCLKNVTHLKNLGKFFYDSNLTFKNIMIIDDEWDQATLNANAEIKGKNPTILYQRITNILNNLLKKFVYIQVTATPYANLFLRDADVLKPRFLQLTYPGTAYMGLSDFHGENSNKFIIIIDKVEIQNCEKWDINPINSESFQKALSTFLIASCLKMDDDQTVIDSESKMLIHTERYVKEHSMSAISLDNFIKILKAKSEIEDKSDLRFFNYLQFCNLGFREYFERNWDYFNNENDKAIIDNLKFIFKSLEVVEVNRTNPIRNRKKLSHLKHVILIGAYLVERSITISNLLVTYITRRSKCITNADTTLQRARWFGYRRKIEKYIRIFCLQEIQDDYEKILIMDDELWFTLEDLIDNDVFLSECVKSLNLNKKKLRPTRKGVVKWDLEAIVAWHTQIEVQENQGFELDFYSELLKEGISELYYTREHKVIEYSNINAFEKRFSNIFNNILDYCGVRMDFWNYWKLNKINTKVKVFLMNVNVANSFRSLLFNKQIQVFSGRSKKEKTGIYYIGDRKLNEDTINKDLILVEVFKFDDYEKIKNSNKKGILVKKNSIFYAILFSRRRGC